MVARGYSRLSIFRQGAQPCALTSNVKTPLQNFLCGYETTLPLRREAKGEMGVDQSR